MTTLELILGILAVYLTVEVLKVSIEAELNKRTR